MLAVRLPEEVDQRLIGICQAHRKDKVEAILAHLEDLEDYCEVELNTLIQGLRRKRNLLRRNGEELWVGLLNWRD